MGNNFGAPGDTRQQRDIVMTALAMLETVSLGGELRDYSTDWQQPFEFAPGGQKASAG